MSILKDERGEWSSARCALWCVILTSLWLIYRDAASPAFEVPAAAYALLAGLLTALTAWAGGPRIAQYIGPQIGAATAGVASAAKRLPDIFRDDER